jgi:hypothetical protein
MITIQRNKKAFNEFELKAKLSLGKLYALRRALEIYAEQSVVGEELQRELEVEWKNRKLDTERIDRNIYEKPWNTKLA